MIRSLLVFIVLLIIIQPSSRLPGSFNYRLKLDFRKSVGSRENPIARFEYEYQKLVDPQTLEIPAGMRKLELEFQKQIPERRNIFVNGARVEERVYRLSGPFNVGGRTRAAILDIRNENVIIAGGVSGGVWKTTDGGNSWIQTNDPNASSSVTCMTQDTRPGKEDILYFGTGELVGNSPRSLSAPFRGDGVFKSTDGGNTWFQLASTNDSEESRFGSQFQYNWALVANPHRSDVDEVFLASFGGILRSQDGGDSWNAVLGEELFNLNGTIDLNTVNAPCYTNIHQTSEGYFLATLSQNNCSGNDRYGDAGIYFSVDGENWVSITPIPDILLAERTVIGSSGNIIYFLIQGNNESVVSLLRLEITEVNGQIPSGLWSDLSDNIPMLGGQVGDFDSQSSYNMVVSVHPDDPNIVYVGGTNLYRSTDGFTSTNNTKWIGGYSPDNDASRYPNHHPDQHLILYYPSNHNRMLSFNDGGIRLTQNNRADSVTWSSLNNGFVTSQFYQVSQQLDEASHFIVGGMQDNGVYVKNAPIENSPWTRILGGDGGFSYISNGRNFYYASIQNSQIYRMRLNGENNLTSYARVDPAGAGEEENQEYLFINPYILDPKNNNRMFLAGGNVIWRNNNLVQIPGGKQDPTSINWETLEDSELSAGVYTAIAKSAVPGTDRVYAAGWLLSENPETYFVRIDQASERFDEQVKFLNTDAFVPGSHIGCIALDPEDPDHLIVAITNYLVPSLFESFDGGESFEDISGNLEEEPDGTGDGPSIRWAEIIPTLSGQMVFVGTSVGLFSTTEIDGQNTQWVKESPEVIGRAVVNSMNYRHLDGRLVIGTHGTGVYEVLIDDHKVIERPDPGTGFSILNAYPNPMQDFTTISYQLPEDGVVKADILSASGQLVKTILWGSQYAGDNILTWDATNTAGSKVRNGMYFCRIGYQNQSEGVRIMVSR
ncbi:MAG: FlgD immunoglobulin-like domain containing protein [Cyclobacteriaceae bacterium]